MEKMTITIMISTIALASAIPTASAHICIGLAACGDPLPSCQEELDIHWHLVDSRCCDNIPGPGPCIDTPEPGTSSWPSNAVARIWDEMRRLFNL